MMNVVIDKFVEVLSTPPEPVLGSSRLGAKKPSNGSEVPAIAVSLHLENGKGTGIGRFIRAGDTIVQNTAVIEVQSTPETFSSDLKSLRISPLPLKKNPSSAGKVFTEEDVQIRNVTEEAAPVEYRMTDQARHKTEYELDVSTAQIIFGQPQTEGEKLEVVHWTVTWRDEILGDRYEGSMRLEIWATSFNEADEIARRLQARLKSDRTVLRQKGFLKLQPASLEAAENLLHQSPVGSSFPVWKQKLAYRFVFESEEGGELSSGVPIKRIDVDMDQQTQESFSIP